ncbi:MAG: hypothetical protein ABIU95_07605, partial [Burkholderiales bacterium]
MLSHDFAQSSQQAAQHLSMWAASGLPLEQNEAQSLQHWAQSAQYWAVFTCFFSPFSANMVQCFA